MKISLNTKKNILIIFLVMLSIYQVRQLWFRNYLNRNFFYVHYLKDNVEKNYINNFLYPYKIFTNLGDNKFYMFYNKLNENEIKNFIDYTIELTYKEGKYVETYYNINWNEILKEKSFIYEYKFPIKPNIFAEVFKEKNNTFITKINKFDSIIISPDYKKSNKLNIYFINKKDNCYYEYKLIKSSINDIITLQIQNIYRNLDYTGIYYISSKLVGLNCKNNIFIPKWQGDFYNYRAIKETKLNLEEYSLNNVNSNISLFFDNQATVWQDSKDNVSIYSDENIVVKYFPNNVLEYINYKNNITHKKKTLIEDYSSAINFVNKDIFIKNDYYLSKYEEYESSRKFYFNYRVNGFFIKFDYDTEATNNLSHFIEVTVENGLVTKYRKLSYIYEFIYDEGEYIYTDAMKVINNYNTDEILDISLEYTLDKNNLDGNKNMKLNWMIK